MSQFAIITVSFLLALVIALFVTFAVVWVAAQLKTIDFESYGKFLKHNAGWITFCAVLTFAVWAGLYFYLTARLSGAGDDPCEGIRPYIVVPPPGSECR